MNVYERKVFVMDSTDWAGQKLMGACAEGCYKHFKNGKWVCCKCGT